MATWSCRLNRFVTLHHLLFINLVVLFINLYSLLYVGPSLGSSWPIQSYFSTVMSPEEKVSMVQTLRVLTGTLSAANLTYMPFYGTLLGIYRHHGIVPWDDDVDLLLNESQSEQVKQVLSTLGPDYELQLNTWPAVSSGPSQWKFFSKASKGYWHHSFNWPYIDLFFFKENATHIWDNNAKFRKGNYFQKRQVFPLKGRPFEGLTLSTPCNTKDLLAAQFDTDLCVTRDYNHKSELPVFPFSVKEVPCNDLHNFQPFVHRHQNASFVTESLKLSSYTLRTVKIPNSCN